MAAKKKRMVWRISDIVRAICKERGLDPGSYDASYVLRRCDGRSVDSIIDAAPVSLPKLLRIDNYEPSARVAAALVATAKRLRVPMVPA